LKNLEFYAIQMIQLNCFYFSILLFGWSNKKFHCHNFWANFINLNFFGPHLKIKIRGQFVNFKKIRGQIIILKKIDGQIIKIYKSYPKMMTMKFFITLSNKNI